MAFAFHPEIGGDTRLHERFLTGLGIESRETPLLQAKM
jgi:glutamine amidotransferase PdxT